MHEKEIIRLYREGYSIQRIAILLRVGKNRVHKLVKQEGFCKHGAKSLSPLVASKVVEAYQAGFSTCLIADVVGVSPHTVRNYLKDANMFTTQRSMNRDDVLLHDIFGDLINQIRPYYKPLKRKVPEGYDKHPSWKGGRVVDEKGYVSIKLTPSDPYFCMVKNRTKYVFEHRYVMAQHLGRPLEKYEQVHHKDGNRQNNEISNLQLRVKNHGSGVTCRCRACGSNDIEFIEL